MQKILCGFGLIPKHVYAAKQGILFSLSFLAYVPKQCKLTHSAPALLGKMLNSLLVITKR